MRVGLTSQTQYKDITDYEGQNKDLMILQFEQKQIEKVKERKALMERMGVFLPTTTFHDRKLSTLRMQELQPLLTW